MLDEVPIWNEIYDWSGNEFDVMFSQTSICFVFNCKKKLLRKMHFFSFENRCWWFRTNKMPNESIFSQSDYFEIVDFVKYYQLIDFNSDIHSKEYLIF